MHNSLNKTIKQFLILLIFNFSIIYCQERKSYFSEEAYNQYVLNKNIRVEGIKNNWPTDIEFYVHSLIDMIASFSGAYSPEDFKKNNEALILSAKCNDIMKVKKILKKGADINTVDDLGRTALMWAANNGYLKMAELLINKGSNLNSKDDFEGFTALTLASRRGFFEIVKLLIDNNADKNILDNRGCTALEWAEANNNFEIAKLLKPKYQLPCTIL